jgi:hypothetical protein
MLKGDAQKNNLLSFLNPSGRPGEPIQIMGRGNLNNIQWSMDGVDLNSFLKR